MHTVACLLAFGVVIWSRLNVNRSKLDVAILVCDGCNMGREWVTQTIEDIRASGQTREQAIDSWEETYRVNNPEDLEEAREICLGCVEAICDVAIP